MPALDIWVRAVRLKEWVLTPTKLILAQAFFRSLSAINLVIGFPGRPPGNRKPGLTGYACKSEANPGWMSTTRVFSFPLVVHFLRVKVSPLMSPVWSAKASLIRQPANKQMPNSALSRGVTNPSVNSCFNSSWVRTFPCPLPLTFTA